MLLAVLQVVPRQRPVIVRATSPRGQRLCLPDGATFPVISVVIMVTG
jgi:hypothetical protein